MIMLSKAPSHAQFSTTAKDKTKKKRRIIIIFESVGRHCNFVPFVSKANRTTVKWCKYEIIMFRRSVFMKTVSWLGKTSPIVTNHGTFYLFSHFKLIISVDFVYIKIVMILCFLSSDEVTQFIICFTFINVAYLFTVHTFTNNWRSGWECSSEDRKRVGRR